MTDQELAIIKKRTLMEYSYKIRAQEIKEIANLCSIIFNNPEETFESEGVWNEN